MHWAAEQVPFEIQQMVETEVLLVVAGQLIAVEEYKLVLAGSVEVARLYQIVCAHHLYNAELRRRREFAQVANRVESIEC